jgi:hydroxymethylglutaryl-CoA lyase
MNRVKIYEMFLRDGLQSLKKIYTVPQKIQIFNSLNRCNYNCIEFGSTTNPKILPQVGGSFELWNHVKEHKNIQSPTKYTMLVPSINHIENVINSDINSYGFVMSTSNEFSQRNMKMTSEQAFNQVKELIGKTLNSNIDKGKLHIRVYISCSFGCPWEGFSGNHMNRLDYFVSQLSGIGYKNGLSSDQFDIVLADTVGMSDKYTLGRIIDDIDDINYVGLHMHMPGKIVDMELKQNFESVIETALNKRIRKFDTSLFGVGGCPYAKQTESSDSIGNLSTIPMVKFVNSMGFQTDVQLEALEEQAKKIKDIL